jgi:gluconokinase
LRDTEPDAFRAVRHWMSLGEYVYLRLFGDTAAGTSTAAWTGMLGRRTGDWDPKLLNACGVSAEQLSEIRNPDRPIDDVDRAVGRKWPALKDTVCFRLSPMASRATLGPAPGMNRL